MSVLVTGGAGYVGSHIVRLLQERGDEVIVVDDLSTGDAARVSGAELIQLDLAGDDAWQVLTDKMIDQDVDTVIHLAAKKQVPESVKRPAHYYRQNVGGLANVLRAMYDAGVNDIVFASSAAVYADAGAQRISEDDATEPASPYGRTKLIGEQLLSDAKVGWGLNPVSLRAFNTAGAGWPDLAETDAANLIPAVLDRLEGDGTPVVYGDNYQTPDGTAVRDFVHVLDSAQAHIAAMDALRAGTLSGDVFNVGTGRGTSVEQILNEMRGVSGWDFGEVVEVARPGDLGEVIADNTRLTQDLGFTPTRSVGQIVRSAWDARQAGPRPVTVPQ